MNHCSAYVQLATGLDEKMVYRLKHYLQERENRLARQLLTYVQPLPFDRSVPLLPLADTSTTLNGAIEIFSKQLRDHRGDAMTMDSAYTETLLQVVNKIFWEFTEVLEGCITELFQQVRQVPIDRWTMDLYNTVHAIKDLLIRYIEEVIWAIRRLEDHFEKIFKADNGLFRTFFAVKLFDVNLVKQLNHCQKILQEKDHIFKEQYQEYCHLHKCAIEDMQKFAHYPIFALLDHHDQQILTVFSKLLKIFEYQGETKKINVEITQAIKSVASVDRMIKILKNYLQEIQHTLFKSSLEWKFLHIKMTPHKISDRLFVKITEYKKELRELINIVRQYRFFLIQTDPNPYVSSRLGFTEWIVGQEPEKVKQLLNIIYSTEELEENYCRFTESIELNATERQSQEHAATELIEQVLHEMGQPLISRIAMQERAERLLKHLDSFNELGSADIKAINKMQDFLSKGMQLDWKYHVLHGMTHFHQLYHIHYGMLKHDYDPIHAFHVERLHRLFAQIEEWLSKNDMYAHIDEIELDINDIKTYLQKFLGKLQQVVKEKSQKSISIYNYTAVLKKYAQHLLEYRYIFGQFFFNITAKNPNEFQVRNQFLFVDQYFESITNLMS